MKIQGAVIKEQGATFAVVIVKQSAMQTATGSEEQQSAARRYFPGMPIVLASQDSHGTFQYWGRNDLVKFLASISADRIPWKEYTFS